MRVPRVFQDQTLAVDQQLILDERATKHLVQVLRFGVGREIILFNGLGGEYHAKLIEATKKKAIAHVTNFVNANREPDIRIHLGQCISKGDRFEFAIQKSVELGVHTITPIFSHRSQLKLNNERKEKKLKHWQQIALSACEQSGRTHPVIFNEPVYLNNFLAETSSQPEHKMLLHPTCDLSLSENLLAQKNNNTQAYRLLIGPEGGFDDDELNLAEQKSFNKVKLGNQVLRTETAPIAAISAIFALENIF